MAGGGRGLPSSLPACEIPGSLVSLQKDQISLVSSDKMQFRVIYQTDRNASRYNAVDFFYF